jgi:hypothetical protein
MAISLRSCETQMLCCWRRYCPICCSCCFVSYLIFLCVHVGTAEKALDIAVRRMHVGERVRLISTFPYAYGLHSLVGVLRLSHDDVLDSVGELGDLLAGIPGRAVVQFDVGLLSAWPPLAEVCVVMCLCLCL